MCKRLHSVFSVKDVLLRLHSNPSEFEERQKWFGEPASGRHLTLFKSAKRVRTFVLNNEILSPGLPCLSQLY